MRGELKDKKGMIGRAEGQKRNERESWGTKKECEGELKKKERWADGWHIMSKG